MQDFQAYGVGKTDIMEVKYRKYKAPISPSICNDVMTDNIENGQRRELDVVDVNVGVVE